MNIKTLVIIGVLIAALIGGKMYSESTASSGNGDYQVDLTTDPNPLRTGNGTFIISVKDPQGNAVKDAKVSFSLDMVTMHHGSQKGEAASQGDGRYAANGRIMMRGDWSIKTKIMLPTGKDMDKEFTVTAN